MKNISNKEIARLSEMYFSVDAPSHEKNVTESEKKNHNWSSLENNNEMEFIISWQVREPEQNSKKP
jgi:hypothetical protein